MTDIKIWNPRVKRSFSEISAFLTLQKYHGAHPPEAIRVFESIAGRINAMALLHRVLYDNHKVSEVDMRLYLRNLKNGIFQAHGIVEHRKILCFIETNNISLKDKQAKACGLIINELIANSILHAFKDKMEGKIKISLSFNAKGDYHLSYFDNGSGLQKGWKNKRSLGLMLVRQLVENELKGKMRMQNETGLHYDMTFPNNF